ncbi:MAG: 6-carboxytetrahydropterin synthase [Pseudomonadota bacterium]
MSTATSATATLFAAEAGFESARQLHALPAGHPASRLHGHGFRVRVRAPLESGWSAFPGAEVSQMAEALTAAVAPLDRRLLNDLVDEPSDAQLARWVQQRLAELGLPATPLVGVQSTALSGVDLNAQGEGHLWRRYRFHSAHRLPNVPLGHKCGRMHGHGFEAVLHVRLAHGEAAQLQADRLDEHWAPLHHQLNYTCLNELPGLENPTSEMLSGWIWQRLHDTASGLVSVKVYETASCGAQYDGHNYRIWKDFNLDSALRLRHAPEGHSLAGLHGHTYKLRLHLSAPLDEVMGWAYDFGDVKEVFKPVFKALDHHALHDIPSLHDADAAHLGDWVLGQARQRLPQLHRVDVFETEGCGAIVGFGELLSVI